MRLPARHLPLHLWNIGLLAGLLACSAARAWQSDWSVGVYAGRYYDTEPAGLVWDGKAPFENQYLLALTASKTLWRSETWPMSLELDAMLGQQWGLASLQEVAVAPVLRWSGFPWNQTLQTDLRLGPLGLSHTTVVGPLERNSLGQGSQTLNFLTLELAFSGPQHPEHEVFVRLHHRCTIYDWINSYGANGEDFLAIGYRHRF